ncbi:type II CRISPR-associated endonuclease Cas1 [Sphingobacterium rhinopitheci]|uniref:type II CRISPR-associated endonuclease Cas1 n=1 Tax=Sphingobacterium rhinopitheci TaxID=2781960 RepID=UPI001F51DD79|nr:type II CRISPR-associated endonuclease Cas1 [Sphingobacterium rhinopitheci]MCI0922696.1 type II CRISPR-associated endonuclease Cas1 [Sphingobacterium rhinopitheci]
MIKRTLVFSNPTYLSLGNQQLIISFPEKEKESKTVPIEDIGVLVMEHQQITISHAVIAAMLENNVAIISCDSTHMPTGLLLPLDGGHTQSERFRYQIEASLPLKKQLWQQTISAKIYNQSRVLEELGHPVENMYRWSKNVRSGDPDNYEGRAAAYYWQHIFSPYLEFYRGRSGDPPNNLLNYGYAILRAIVARGLVSSGLLPTLGIFHRNKYNAYCLADDIMEPYRPYVDKIVYAIVAEGLDYGELNTELKIRLLQLPQVTVRFEDISSPLLVAISRTTASLARCFEGISRKINYPEL